MAIQIDTSEIRYLGNGPGTMTYAVPFLFLDAADVAVIVTDKHGFTTKLILHQDYEVTGAGSEDGGVMTTSEVIPTTSTVTIYREVEATQLTVYDEGSEFPAKSHERALDKLTMLVQQVSRGTGRSLQVLVADPIQRPVHAMANTLLGFNGTQQVSTYTIDQIASKVTLAANTPVAKGMLTFEDEDERELVKPEFVGQLATQWDGETLWISTAEEAGAWVEFQISADNVPEKLISLGKLANMTDGKLLGRSSSGAGGPMEINIGSGLALSAGTLSATPGSAVPSLASWRALRLARASVNTIMMSIGDIVFRNEGALVRHSTASPVTVNIANTGLNGRDEGTEASSTWYYIWAISNGTTLGGLLSTDAEEPTTPSGYDYKHLLGAVYNDGSSNFVDFVQIDNTVWSTPRNVFTNRAGSTSSYATISLDGVVPPNAMVVSGNVGVSDGQANINVAATAGGLGRVVIRAANATAMDGYNAAQAFTLPLRNAPTMEIFFKTSSTASVFSMEITGWQYL